MNELANLIVGKVVGDIWGTLTEVSFRELLIHTDTDLRITFNCVGLDIEAAVRTGSIQLFLQTLFIVNIGENVKIS